MAATRLIAMHQNKGKTIAQCLKARTEYAKNGDKTEKQKYVSSYMCNAEIADKEFALSKRTYLHRTGRRNRNDIIAYQIRQSFRPGEITPEEANQVGYETAMRFTKGRHAFIVCTHTDRPHIHNHIIFNSTDLDCERKFKDTWFIALGLQKLSDIICLEHGLSVIIPRRPSERDNRNPYHRVSHRSVIREQIDSILEKQPESFEKFLDELKDEGYEIKRRKHTAVRGKGQQRFIRLDSLGGGYTESDLIRAIEGEERSDQKPHEKKSQKPVKKRDFEYLIDIQEKLRQGKGKGYEYWAKNFNTKQVADTIVFLQRNEVTSYDLLKARTEYSAKKFHEVSDRIKDCEDRLDDITEMKKAIINFAKTKKLYEAYHKSGYSKKFFEEHRAEILLYRSAKDVFKKYKGQKIPKVKELSEEFGKVLAEKRKLYEDYKDAKKEMMDYQIAKSNVDRIRGYQPDKDEPDRSKTEKDKSR